MSIVKKKKKTEIKKKKPCKSYKSLLEYVKHKSRMNYYSSKALEFKNNAKITWGVMKELLGKSRNTQVYLNCSSLSIKKEMTSLKDIAEEVL